MKYFDVNEILNIIDRQFRYDFETKDKDDHLISNKTWNKYVREFFDEKIFMNANMNEYKDKIKGEKKYTRYREDLVEEVINFRKNQLIKQFNSNRKTTVDHEAIKTVETFASVLGLEVDEGIYNKRLPINQYKKEQEERYPAITKEGIESGRDNLLQIVIKQLIDIEKLNHDVYQQIITGSLDYGYADPLEMVEDVDGFPIGFRIDAKNYLKESVKDEIIKHNYE